jgi:hypothetical protein
LRDGERRARGDCAVYFDAASNSRIGALDLGRDAAGRGQRLEVSGRTRTVALHRLRELRRRLEAGDVTTHDKMLVPPVTEDFLERGLPPRLASNTRYLIKLYAQRFADSSEP